MNYTVDGIKGTIDYQLGKVDSEIFVLRDFHLQFDKDEEKNGDLDVVVISQNAVFLIKWVDNKGRLIGDASHSKLVVMNDDTTVFDNPYIELGLYRNRVAKISGATEASIVEILLLSDGLKSEVLNQRNTVCITKLGDFINNFNAEVSIAHIRDKIHSKLKENQAEQMQVKPSFNPCSDDNTEIDEDEEVAAPTSKLNLLLYNFINLSDFEKLVVLLMTLSGSLLLYQMVHFNLKLFAVSLFVFSTSFYGLDMLIKTRHMKEDEKRDKYKSLFGITGRKQPTDKKSLKANPQAIIGLIVLCGVLVYLKGGDVFKFGDQNIVYYPKETINRSLISQNISAPDRAAFHDRMIEMIVADGHHVRIHSGTTTPEGRVVDWNDIRYLIENRRLPQ